MIFRIGHPKSVSTCETPSGSFRSRSTIFCPTSSGEISSVKLCEGFGRVRKLAECVLLAACALQRSATHRRHAVAEAEEADFAAHGVHGAALAQARRRVFAHNEQRHLHLDARVGRAAQESHRLNCVRHAVHIQLRSHASAAARTRRDRAAPLRACFGNTGKRCGGAPASPGSSMVNTRAMKPDFLNLISCRAQGSAFRRSPKPWRRKRAATAARTRRSTSCELSVTSSLSWSNCGRGCARLGLSAAAAERATAPHARPRRVGAPG